VGDLLAVVRELNDRPLTPARRGARAGAASNWCARSGSCASDTPA